MATREQNLLQPVTTNIMTPTLYSRPWSTDAPNISSPSLPSFFTAEGLRPWNDTPVLSTSYLYLAVVVHSESLAGPVFNIASLASLCLLCDSGHLENVCTEILGSDHMVDILQFLLRDGCYKFSECTDLVQHKLIGSVTIPADSWHRSVARAKTILLLAR